MSKRQISESFIWDLKEGMLVGVVEAVKNDKTLMLCIRDSYINIYYHGGSIMKITEVSEGSYKIEFDVNYLANYKSVNLPDSKVSDKARAGDWINILPQLKDAMDRYFSQDKREKAERTYQQLVCRENNRSGISNATDYFIVDIEYSAAMPDSRRAQIDMIAVRWLASERGKRDADGYKTVSLAFIEMKYGDDAIKGKAIKGGAGIEKHLEDMRNAEPLYESIRESAEFQLNILNELGLIQHTNPNCKFKVKLDKKPEYIMLFANSNPRSKVLDSVMETCETFNNAPDRPFKLKFYVANYAGYGLYEQCIKSFEQFANLINMEG